MLKIFILLLAALIGIIFFYKKPSPSAEHREFSETSPAETQTVNFHREKTLPDNRSVDTSRSRGSPPIAPVQKEEEPIQIEAENFSELERERTEEDLEKLKDLKVQLKSSFSEEDFRIVTVEILRIYAHVPLSVSMAAEARSQALASLKIATDRRSENNGLDFEDFIHQSNIILGRLALASGDVEKAKIYLMRAAATQGSPVLSSFGPNIILARELLLKKETKAVLAYFDACLKFWEMGKEKVAGWKRAIDQGQIPDFGSTVVH